MLKFFENREGSRSGSVPVANRSVSGSGRPKNMGILRIRIHNTDRVMIYVCSGRCSALKRPHSRGCRMLCATPTLGHLARRHATPYHASLGRIHKKTVVIGTRSMFQCFGSGFQVRYFAESGCRSWLLLNPDPIWMRIKTKKKNLKILNWRIF